MSTLLMDAFVAQRKTRKTKKARSGGEPSKSINYATMEHAGKPHRGKTTEAEKELMRSRLEEINARLRAEGIREVDPTNPEHAARYGFPMPSGNGQPVTKRKTRTDTEAMAK